MRTIAVAAALTLALAACGQNPPQQKSGAAPYALANLQKMSKAADGADGSGCLSDSGTLADGAWFGYVTAWNAAGLTLDPACFFTGEEAANAATARNDESPPPNDFYIANDTKVVRQIPVAAGAKGVRVTHTSDGGVTNEDTTYADLIVKPGTYQSCPSQDQGCPVWVFVNGGAATEVAVQYLP